MPNSHYYSKSTGQVIKRPAQNPEIEAGRKAGYKQRRKDKADRVYPREGLPISRESRDSDWIEGYQRGYYQSHKRLESNRVQTSVTLDRALLEAVDTKGLNRSRCCDLGLSIVGSGLDQRLLEVWGDEISGMVDNGDGTWTIFAGRDDYTAATPLEALLLMLCDRDQIFTGLQRSNFWRTLE